MDVRFVAVAALLLCTRLVAGEGTCEIDKPRVDCGYTGVTQEQCVAKGCCWSEAESQPWCFFKALKGKCVADQSRVDCGYVGIQQAECEENDCCWNPEMSKPWCFRKVYGSDTQCQPNFPRVECGYIGITEDGCGKQGCCWNPTEKENEPWCFQRTPVPDGECLVDGQRNDCGGSNEQECNSKGCCWNAKDGEPWCFYRTKLGVCRNSAPRYDCGWTGVDETGCRSKGCCWKPKEDDPWCFYSTPAYVVTAITTTTLGVKMTLEIDNAEGYNLPYGDNISPLTFELYQETDDRVRVKISDSTLPRWEVPESIFPSPALPSSPPSNPKYGFKLPDKVGQEFFFTITRSETGETIFDTTGVGMLQFADQYLQIGSRLPDDYNVYGLGEHETNFRLKKGMYTLYNMDVLTPRFNNLYSSWPFYLEHRPGKSHGVFLKNSNGMDVVLEENSIVYKVIGGIFDFYFFLGPEPESVVQQFQEVIGRPWLPPYWSLGFHNARFGYPNVDVLNSVLTNYENSKIPLDGFWVDIEYMDGYRDFTLDPNKFPKDKMQALAKRLHDSDKKMVVVVDPGIKVDVGYSAWDNGLKDGIFVRDYADKVFIGNVWPGLVGYPDFFHPKAESYWTKELAAFHSNLLPVDGIWLDMNEASNFGTGQASNIDWINRDQAPDFCPAEEKCVDYHQRPGFKPNNPPYRINNQGVKQDLNIKNLDMDAKQHGGIVYYDSHNLYGVSEAIATNHAMQQITGKRPFVLGRSTFPGAGSVSGHWLGDNQANYDDLYHSIAGMLNFQLFGIPYVGADVCGFQFDTTEDLCGRWMELASFYPFSRSHNIDAGPPQEPYVWPSVAAISRKYLGIRYSLLPYFYTLFYKAHRPANPSAPSATVVRPLFFEFPSDTSTFEVDWQFMTGNALLITPVLVKGRVSVRVYFPRAKWYDWYTHKVASENGGEAQELSTPWDHMQIHIRGGTIIPTQEPGLTAAASKRGKFSLLVALDNQGSARGDLFLDDGESIDETQSYSFINYEASNKRITATVQGTGYATSLPVLDQVTVMGVTGTPGGAQLNGKTVSGFQFDAESGSMILTGLAQNMGEKFDITW